MTVTRNPVRGAEAAALVAILGTALACSGAGDLQDPADRIAARIGREPVPVVHLFENHSSALMAWRQAGVRDRVLLHLDGHADFDWLPDATVARIAAADPEELPDLELHPYAMDGSTLSRFAIWNWIYPAARLGIVREMIWVVPDGTLEDPAASGHLVRDILLAKIQKVGLEESRSLRPSAAAIRGTLLGLPVTICELAGLPEVAEPVLLDIDLDYFSTQSAVTQQVTAVPWTSPARVVAALERRGARSDLATVSLSSLGGFLPLGSRWLGREVQRLLRSPGSRGDASEAERRRAAEALAAGAARDAAAIWERLASRSEDDATAWYGLALALDAAGEPAAAASARGRAVALDPIFAHEDLLEGDRLWINEEHSAALTRFERYLAGNRSSPFAAYAARRRANCLAKLGRSDEAIAALRDVIVRAPEHGDSRLDLALLLRQRGDLGGAIEELQAARRILPDRAVYALALGTTYLLGGSLDRGTPELEAAVSLQPCLAQARGNLAVALFRVGRLEEASRHLEVAMSLHPPTPQMLELASRLDRAGVPLTRVSAP